MLTSDRVTFGLVAAAAEPDRRVLLADFCAALGDSIGARVRPHLAPSSHALASAALAGRVQLAFFSAAALVRSPFAGRAAPVAVASRGGVAVHHAAIFVAPGSPIKSPADLAGSRIAWVSSTSATGYVWPRAELARRDLALSAFFASESFLGSHDAVARAVGDREADAGATYLVFDRGEPGRTIVRAGFRKDGRGEGRVVLVAGPIPGDMVVAAPDFAVSLRARVVRALQALAADRDARVAVAALFRADGFEPATAQTLSAASFPLAQVSSRAREPVGEPDHERPM